MFSSYAEDDARGGLVPPRAAPGQYLKDCTRAKKQVYHTAPARRTGPSQALEEEAKDNNATARNWDEFYRRIEVGGGSGRTYSDEELDNWLADLSEQEIQALEGKLRLSRYEDRFPRAMHSVLEDVFYLVATANWHLKRDGHTREWLENIAFHMHEFQAALKRAQELAGEIEKRTGISGEDLGWE